jgi:cardiolipin synthase
MITVPNILTLLRIFLTPLFIMTVVYKRFEYSLLLFLFASVTDALDGLIARLKAQKTNLGAFLDPVADKLLLISAFLSFTFFNILPKWLTVIIISRDIIIVIGWISLYIQTGSTKVEPSLLGKLSNTFQVFTIGATLLTLNYGILENILKPLYITSASLSTLSCIHYILREIRRL